MSKAFCLYAHLSICTYFRQACMRLKVAKAPPNEGRIVANVTAVFCNLYEQTLLEDLFIQFRRANDERFILSLQPHDESARCAPTIRTLLLLKLKSHQHFSCRTCQRCTVRARIQRVALEIRRSAQVVHSRRARIFLQHNTTENHRLA